MALARIAQLSSAATYDNGKGQFAGNGVESEREAVIADTITSIEDAGYCIRHSIFRMWEGERDRGALLEGLDMPSQRVMGWMLDRLAVEEAREEDEDPEMAAAVVEAKLTEEALTAALLAADPSVGGGKAGQERLLMLLDLAFIFPQGFAEVRAALEGIFAGRRDSEGLCLGLPPRGRGVAFVRMVLQELERPAAELHAAVVGGGKEFQNLRLFVKPPPPKKKKKHLS